MYPSSADSADMNALLPNLFFMNLFYQRNTHVFALPARNRRFINLFLVNMEASAA